MRLAIREFIKTQKFQRLDLVDKYTYIMLFFLRDRDGLIRTRDYEVAGLSLSMARINDLINKDLITLSFNDDIKRVIIDLIDIKRKGFK